MGGSGGGLAFAGLFAAAGDYGECGGQKRKRGKAKLDRDTFLSYSLEDITGFAQAWHGPLPHISPHHSPPPESSAPAPAQLAASDQNTRDIRLCNGLIKVGDEVWRVVDGSQSIPSVE